MCLCSLRVREKEKTYQKERERDRERKTERERKKERAQTVTNSRQLAHENVGILVPIQRMQVKLLFRLFRSITVIK